MTTQTKKRVIQIQTLVTHNINKHIYYNFAMYVNNLTLFLSNLLITKHLQQTICEQWQNKNSIRYTYGKINPGGRILSIWFYLHYHHCNSVAIYIYIIYVIQYQLFAHYDRYIHCVPFLMHFLLLFLYLVYCTTPFSVSF